MDMLLGWLPSETTLRDWQLLIGVGVGFLAVLLMLRSNARRAIKHERRQRRSDANALRTALVAELNQLISIMQADSERAVSSGKEGRFFCSFLDYSPILRAHLDRIGLLTAKEITATLDAHALAADLERKFFLFGGYDVDLSSYGTSVRLMSVPQAQVPHLLALFQATREKAEAAAALLSRHTR